MLHYRFRHKVAHYLETNAMHRDRTWGGLSVGDPHVLSIRVRRSHLLQDSLQLLAGVSICMYVCTYIRMYVCMYVRTYVCMYVCGCVCMYVYICMYVAIGRYAYTHTQDTYIYDIICTVLYTLCSLVGCNIHK